MPKIGEAFVEVRPDTSGFEKETHSGIMGPLGGVAKTAALAFGGAAIAAGAFGLKTAASMEQARISFETMLGSGKKADAFLKDLQAFAAKTPFEFPELQTAASSLISAGVNASKVIPIMTSLGNATSGMGTGSEGVKRATVALQQMSAAGKITGEDLNQLRDAGVPVFDLLAAATGKSKEAVAQLAQSGKLGKKELEQLFSALESGKGLERFSGLMDKQSQSLSGLFSSLKDSVSMTLADLVTPAIPAIKAGMGAISGFVSNVAAPALKATFAGIGAAIEALTPFFTRVKDAVTGLFDLFVKGDFTGKLGDALGIDEDGMVVETLFIIRDTVITVFDALHGAFDTLKAGFGEGGIGGLFAAIPAAINGALPVIGAALQTLGTQLIAWIGPQIGPMLTELGRLWTAAETWLIGTALPAIVETLAKWGKALIEWIGPQIPPFLEELGKFADAAFHWLIDVGLPALLTKLGEWAKAFILWVAPLIPPLVVELVKIATAILKWLATDALPTIVVALAKFALEFVKWVAPLIPPLLLELGKLAAQLLLWLAGLPPKVVLELAKLALKFAEWVPGAALDMMTAIGKLELKLITWLGGLPAKVKDLLADAGTWLVDAGKHIIQGLIDGIEDKFQALKDKLSVVTNLIPDWKGPPAKDATLLTGAGQLVMQGFIDGVRGSFGDVKRAMNDATDLVGMKVGGVSFVANRLAASAATAPTEAASRGDVHVEAPDLSELIEEMRGLRAEFREQTRVQVQYRRTGAI